MPPDAVYLGDGVYASHDGYQLWITTERIEGKHYIALEPNVFRALVRYEASTHPFTTENPNQGA